MLFEVFFTINHTYSMNWFIRRSYLNMCILKVGHTNNVLTEMCLRVCPTKQLICKFYCMTCDLFLKIQSCFYVNLFGFDNTIKHIHCFSGKVGAFFEKGEVRALLLALRRCRNRVGKERRDWVRQL